MIYVLIIAFLVGIFYRFSEPEYIWQYYKNGLRNWVPLWLYGETHYSEKQRKFHKYTLSIFEDGYHFFHGATVFIIVSGAGILYYYSIQVTFSIYDCIAIILSRWLGTKLGLWLLLNPKD